MKSYFFKAFIILPIFLTYSCAPSAITISVSDVDHYNAKMNVEKTENRKKWPAINMFVYEDQEESEFILTSDVGFKRLGECAYDATCYKFVSPVNNRGLKKNVQEFEVLITNNECAYPYGSNEQMVALHGNSKKNKKGYDIMLNDDPGDPLKFEFSRGWFFLDKMDPYPDRIYFSLEFIDPEKNRAVSDAQVRFKMITDKSENQQQLLEEYPFLKCFDESIWGEYVTERQTNNAGFVSIGINSEGTADELYPEIDGSYELEIIAEAEGRIPIKATIRGLNKAGGRSAYKILWSEDPDENSIVDGYLFPVIVQN